MRKSESGRSAGEGNARLFAIAEHLEKEAASAEHPIDRANFEVDALTLRCLGKPPTLPLEQEGDQIDLREVEGAADWMGGIQGYGPLASLVGDVRGELLGEARDVLRAARAAGPRGQG